MQKLKIKSVAVVVVPPKDLLVCLRQMYGPEADWRGPEQYEAVQHLLALATDVIVALRTGGGKTAVAVLPSLVENGYTVIILPLISLMLDWMARLDAMKIKYERFCGADTPRLHGRHNLILVSADMAKGTLWNHAIGALNAQRPVLRYVVDEVQCYALDRTFRAPALSNAFELRRFPCQVVVMSATCPPALMNYLAKEFVLLNPHRISSNSDRAELETVIINGPNTIEKMIHHAKEIIDFTVKKEESFLPMDRYLVFVMSHSDGEAAAAALKLPYYRASDGTNDISEAERADVYGNWVSGKSGLGMVATTALAAGTDYAHVRFTIHLGAPYNIVMWNQQSGRAGRDGEHAINYMLTWPRARKVYQDNLHAVHGDMCGMEAMSQMTHSLGKKEYPESCLVYHATKFMDGKGTTCLDLSRQITCKACSQSGSLFVFFKAGRTLKKLNRLGDWTVDYTRRVASYGGQPRTLVPGTKRSQTETGRYL